MLIRFSQGEVSLHKQKQPDFLAGNAGWKTLNHGGHESTRTKLPFSLDGPLAIHANRGKQTLR